jgi:hypothetical protein
VSEQKYALLGLATTRELLEELEARGEVECEHTVEGRRMMAAATRMLATLPDEMLGYRTVDSK